MKKRTFNGSDEYLVKWKPTWEPVDNLAPGSSRLIQNFEAAHQEDNEDVKRYEEEEFQKIFN